MSTYYFDVIAKLDGTTFGFTAEFEAETFAAAYDGVRAELRSRGWNLVKVRRS